MVALRNRDRLMLIWPLVHDMLATILAPENARDANSLVRRATTGLLRVCRRLLHYKAESSASLLKSLQMVRKLDPEVAWKMAPDIAEEVKHISYIYLVHIYHLISPIIVGSSNLAFMSSSFACQKYQLHSENQQLSLCNSTRTDVLNTQLQAIYRKLKALALHLSVKKHAVSVRLQSPVNESWLNS